MIKKLNKFLKDNLLEIQISLIILFFIILIFNGSVSDVPQNLDLGREALLGGFLFPSIFVTFGLILIGVGAILIVIPEPSTTFTGVIMVVVGGFISGSTLYALVYDYLIYIVPVIIFIIIIKLRGSGGRRNSARRSRARPQVIVLRQNGGRR